MKKHNHITPTFFEMSRLCWCFEERGARDKPRLSRVSVSPTTLTADLII